MRPPTHAPRGRRLYHAGWVTILPLCLAIAACAPVRVPDSAAPAAPEASAETVPASDAGVGGATDSPPRPGLFGFLAKRGPGETAAGPTQNRGEVRASAQAPVAGLPFGQIARVCGLAPRRLGTEVARSEGAGSYRLYDRNPASTAIRPQFITGFDDGCARQFNAALALFGTAPVHEATRYNPQNANPYSATDEAYETVKRRVCGVGRGKACPAGKADRLARNSAFVSVYRGFGDSGDGLEMFLHNGELVAYAPRSN